ncbi:hypothetical protein V6N13_091210 [Hibiscus sabdariffa]|uniref:Uncharacterized protein n=1 Tax=Hibiscus sabdariffa TaxID=183260 RepID=A0ABR2BV41_9ROSI
MVDQPEGFRSPKVTEHDQTTSITNRHREMAYINEEHSFVKLPCSSKLEMIIHGDVPAVTVSGDWNWDHQMEAV